LRCQAGPDALPVIRTTPVLTERSLEPINVFDDDDVPGEPEWVDACACAIADSSNRLRGEFERGLNATLREVAERRSKLDVIIALLGKSTGRLVASELSLLKKKIGYQSPQP
jgi:hypothetical protein